MKDEQIKVLSPPENTSLVDCKGVAGSNAWCGCKSVCIRGPEPDEP